MSFSMGGSDRSSSEMKYGTRTPILGQQWMDAYGEMTKAVNPSGANQAQQTSMDWINQALMHSPTLAQTPRANGYLAGAGDALTTMQQNVLHPMAESGKLRQLGSGILAASATSAPTSQVNAVSGASMADPYRALYDKELISQAMAGYDYGTDRAFSALDARTAGAGAFGNTRSGLAYSDLGAQSAQKRAEMQAGLINTGLTNAFGLGQQDASRNLQGQMTNASNMLANNQFNANLLTQNNQFNANLQDSRDKFNVQAGYQGDQQQLQAAQQIANNIAQRTGLSQQILGNVVDQNGINMQAAQALFAQGAITQGQLLAIASAAQATNGEETTQNTQRNESESKWGIG